MNLDSLLYPAQKRLLAALNERDLIRVRAERLDTEIAEVRGIIAALEHIERTYKQEESAACSD